MLRPARALVVALSQSLLVLAPATASASGTTTEPAQPAEPTEPAGDPMAGAPAVGTCYQLTYDELMAVATPAEPVDCGTRHTAQVLDVLTLPDGLDWDSSPARLDRLTQKACSPAHSEVVKDDPRVHARTLVQFSYFYPDAAEQEAGARWFRCDVSLRTGDTLLRLPEELPRVRRAAAIDDTVGRCVTRKEVHLHRLLDQSPLRPRRSHRGRRGPAPQRGARPGRGGPPPLSPPHHRSSLDLVGGPDRHASRARRRLLPAGLTTRSGGHAAGGVGVPRGHG